MCTLHDKFATRHRKIRTLQYKIKKIQYIKKQKRPATQIFFTACINQSNAIPAKNFRPEISVLGAQAALKKRGECGE